VPISAGIGMGARGIIPTVALPWDDRWRTGGSVEELKVEAHIDPASLWKGIERFASEREQRLAELRVT
jgi:hypothetical protein